MKTTNAPKPVIGAEGDMLPEYFLDRAPRLSVALPAVITTAGDDGVGVMITNLSSAGFAVDTPRSVLIWQLRHPERARDRGTASEHSVGARLPLGRQVYLEAHPKQTS